MKSGLRRHRAPFRNHRVEATAFLHEVVMTADCLIEARTFGGEPAMHFGYPWKLLRAIERCGGAPTFSDLGRLLRMSRQGARAYAPEAARTGLVERFQSPDDRRAWHVMLTPAGRSALEARRMPDSAWMLTLLNGLDPAAMHSTQHILQVVRRRLAPRAIALA
jgi:DNA-binding MarR family transcriptional regulator